MWLMRWSLTQRPLALLTFWPWFGGLADEYCRLPVVPGATMGILRFMTGLSLPEGHWLFLVLPLDKGLLTDGGCRRLCFH